MTTETLEKIDTSRMREERVDITPALAKEWWEQNTRNRNHSPEESAKWIELMEAGEWYAQLGEPYAFDWHNVLINGQHRLYAIIQSGFTVYGAKVLYNCDPKMQAHFDRGRTRRVGNDLDIAGFTNGTTVGAIVRLMMDWDAGRINTRSHRHIHQRILLMAKKRREEYEEAERMGAKVNRLIPTPPSVVGAMRLRTMAVDPGGSNLFFDEVMYPRKPADAPGCPARALNHILIRKGGRTPGGEKMKPPTRMEAVYYWAKAWDLWRTGEQIDKLQLPPTGTLAMKHILPILPRERKLFDVRLSGVPSTEDE